MCRATWSSWKDLWNPGDEESKGGLESLPLWITAISGSRNLLHPLPSCLRRALCSFITDQHIRDRLGPVLLPGRGQTWWYFANKGPYSQSYGISSSHVWMWELDHKESCVPKDWCLLTVVQEKILESLLDCQEIKLVNLKGNQSSIFIRRTDAEAPILWPPDAKSQLIRKGPDNWDRLKAGGEGDNRGRGGWMASLTQWTWI